MKRDIGLLSFLHSAIVMITWTQIFWGIAPSDNTRNLIMGGRKLHVSNYLPIDSPLFLSLNLHLRKTFNISHEDIPKKLEMFYFLGYGAV
jgi:hypothetical protein